MTDEPKDRYDQWYSLGKGQFYLSDYTLDEQEARFILLKVVEQAVRDYINLRNPANNTQKEDWESARSFLFDDDHHIDMGDLTLNLEQICEILNIDMDWFRQKTQKKFVESERIKHDGQERQRNKLRRNKQHKVSKSSSGSNRKTVRKGRSSSRKG